MRTLTVSFVVTLMVALAAGAEARGMQDQPARSGRTIGADQKFATLTLVRSAGDRAVIRFGAGPLEIVSRGDRLGSAGAVVVDVATGRLVLEEHVRGARAGTRTVIVLADGETGGTRYVSHLNERAPLGVRPQIGRVQNPK